MYLCMCVCVCEYCNIFIWHLTDSPHLNEWDRKVSQVIYVVNKILAVLLVSGPAFGRMLTVWLEAFITHERCFLTAMLSYFAFMKPSHTHTQTRTHIHAKNMHSALHVRLRTHKHTGTHKPTIFMRC